MPTRCSCCASRFWHRGICRSSFIGSTFAQTDHRRRTTLTDLTNREFNPIRDGPTWVRKTHQVKPDLNTSKGRKHRGLHSSLNRSPPLAPVQISLLVALPWCLRAFVVQSVFPKT